jgi:hypothetical protein
MPKPRQQPVPTAAPWGADVWEDAVDGGDKIHMRDDVMRLAEQV